MDIASTALIYLGYAVFFLIMLAAILSIMVGLPGAWIILAEAVVFGLITHFAKGIAGYDLLALALIAGAGELLEFLITAYGAKRFGASNRAVLAALLGGLAGAMVLNSFIPVIGALVGAFIGVFLGAFIHTYLAEREIGKALSSGVGAFMGRMGAVLVKGALAIAMAAVIITQIF